MFKSVVYSMALLGHMVKSREEWNISYLQDLREKFLQQEYPLQLINEQFTKALSVDRMDLLLGNTNNKKKKRKIVAPLVITYNPGNPKFIDWIKSEISILHEDQNLKKLFPQISVVTRQTQNIKRRIMRNKYTRKEINPNIVLPPPGNYRHHDPARCVCCARMEDDQKKVKITKTGREYMVKRHYT